MKLRHLHEEFLDNARRPMSFGTLPVAPKPPADVPIVISNKWKKTDGYLEKSYRFRLLKQRNNFLKELLNHEEEVKHHALMSIDEDTVTLRLQTRDIQTITELDKEYAKWTDELYRDVVYSQVHD
jgi:pterin-4a-carbinolamine dehydratase